jgi:hypothetical protein
MLAPAFAAPTEPKNIKQVRPIAGLSISTISSFTPSVADPRLAAAFARRSIQANSFRFTPSASSGEDKSKSIKVAVRARAATPAQAIRSLSDPAGTITAITPTAYNLGVAVGWKSFALSGDVARVEGGIIPGGREAAEVGVSYSTKKFAGSIQLAADRTDGTQPRAIVQESSYSVDVGGSYSLARNLDLTGGVRYKIQRDRLVALDDERRDSQAIYIGTAFRF